MDNPGREDLEGLDLSALVEYERKPGGGVRIRMVDRGALLGALMRADPGEGNPEAVAAFYAALEGVSGNAGAGHAGPVRCPDGGAVSDKEVR